MFEVSDCLEAATVESEDVLRVFFPVNSINEIAKAT